ncbi:ribosome recycling factor [Candidatus Mycoplasma pogonae]
MEFEIYKEMFDDEMKRAFDHFEKELNKIATGRVNPQLVSYIKVEYYGELTPIEQIANIVVAQAQQLLIKPFDITSVKTIVSVLNDHKLDVQISNEGNQIRLIFPQMTTERRRDLVKKVGKIAEEAKVQVRLTRQNILKQIKNDEEITEDLEKKYSDDVQKITDKYIQKINDMINEKEKDLMTI